jgi:translocator protein
MGRIHYILAPLFYLMIALFGRSFTGDATSGWYAALSKPPLTPSGGVIGIAWTIIYILSAISLIVFVSRGRSSPGFAPIIGLYILNGVANALWSYIFFERHMLGVAVVDAGVIWLTVALLILFTRKNAPLASVLLVPYLAWVSFALYLSYAIWRLN